MYHIYEWSTSLHLWHGWRTIFFLPSWLGSFTLSFPPPVVFRESQVIFLKVLRLIQLFPFLYFTMTANSCLSSPWAEHNHWLALNQITQGFSNRRNPSKLSTNILIWPTHTQLARAPQNLNLSQFLHSMTKT